MTHTRDTQTPIGMYYLKAPKVRSPEVAKSRRSAMARTDYERRKALEEGLQVNVFQFFGFV